MPPNAPRPEPHQVCVWHAETRTLFPDAATRSRAEASLEPADRTRFESYRNEGDRTMFLAGRVMARALVASALGVAPHGWRWREGPHGRPEVDSPETTIRFNLAHSAGLVACAIANGRDVGVDVEYLRRRPVDPQVVRRYCSPDEVRDIEAHQPAWHDRFLLYWTLKEAYLKARGLGIAVPLADISFRLDGGVPRVTFLRSLAGTDDRWHFHRAQPTPQHLMAVAAAVDGTAPTITVTPLRTALV
jgi:4'-phosphopantetheinyl transferase